jgi:hypothetical protein
MSGSESSAFSSKSLGSDLRLMINRLHKEYREQSRDTRRGCQRCRSKPHGREDCPARFKICHVCKCLGHLKVMCPTVTGSGRGKGGKARNQEARTERASDRKRERSVSVINDKPRKPQRKEHDTNVPGNRERTRDRTNHDSKERQTPAIPSRFKGLNHPDLPIRSIFEPGTPAEQYRKWLSDDPPRIHKIRPEIDRWKEHFKLSKERPVALDDFDGNGTEKLVWWREFLIETGRISAIDVHHT